MHLIGASTSFRRIPSLAALALVMLAAPAGHAAPGDRPDKAEKEREKAEKEREKAACIAAFDEGQRSKTEHHLKLAQSQLLACTKETCPPVLRADCAEVLRSVQAAVPSVVLAADDAGADITDVRVTNAGTLIAASLDGKSLELDPGTYDLTFERARGKPVLVHFVLREGEKSRTVRASFGERKLAPAPLMLVPEARSTAGWVVPAGFATLAVAGFVVAGVARLSFDGQVEDLRATCAPNCTQEERAEVSSKVVLSNLGLGFGIGGVVLAAASWLLFAPGTKAIPARSSALLRW